MTFFIVIPVRNYFIHSLNQLLDLLLLEAVLHFAALCITPEKLSLALQTIAEGHQNRLASYPPIFPADQQVFYLV